MSDGYSGPATLLVDVALDAGAGPAVARLGDVDPWGRLRVTGVGPLPHPDERESPFS